MLLSRSVLLAGPGRSGPHVQPVTDSRFALRSTESNPARLRCLMYPTHAPRAMLRPSTTSVWDAGTRADPIRVANCWSAVKWACQRVALSMREVFMRRTLVRISPAKSELLEHFLTIRNSPAAAAGNGAVSACLCAGLAGGIRSDTLSHLDKSMFH